jgi:ribosome biogenesis protein Nip4
VQTQPEERQLTKPIVDFALKVKAKIAFDLNLAVETGGRYFLLNKNLKAIAPRNFFYAGTYLGKAKNGKFFPSFNLLAILSESATNKVEVDEKAAWLFICGRDIFGGGIVSVQGSKREGDFTLVLNEFGECLGFGKIIGNLRLRNMEVVLRNISDVGDFLRREH